MKKTKLFTLLAMLMVFCGTAFASNPNPADSILAPKASKFKTEFSIATRNVFRGVSYGQSPSVYALGSYAVSKSVEIGTYGYTTLNGNAAGYGNQINLYVAVKLNKKISVTLDDYFYFNSNDGMNNYWDWSNDVTSHFIEARVKYDNGDWYLVAAPVVYQNKNLPTAGVYFEGGYNLSNDFSAFAGYLTDHSAVNFQSEGGVTNIGVTWSQKLNISSVSPILKVSLVSCPTYRTITNTEEGVGHNPINLVAALTFK